MSKGEPEEIITLSQIREGIIRIVRLLPVNASFKDYGAIYEELLEYDPYGHIEEIYREKATLWGSNDISWFLDNREFPEDEHIFASTNIDCGFYELEALRHCVSHLPDEFVEYVNLPQWSSEHLFNEIKKLPRELSRRFSSLESFQAMVSAKPDSLSRIYYGVATREACNRYENAVYWYKQLYSLAELAEQFVLQEGSIRGNLQSRIFESIRVEIAAGRFHFRRNLHSIAFDGLPANRLSLCDVCGKVFLVGRIGTKSCSNRCANVLSSRNYRKKMTPEQIQTYKENRVLNELKKNEED